MIMSNLLGMQPLSPVISDPDGSIFVSSSYFGVELEIEHNDSSAFRKSKNWTIVSEGSISGYEAVLSRPMQGKDLYLALMDADACFNSMGDLSEAFSERTSTHIHVNILDMTFTQLLNFICLGVLFEKVLFKYVAPHRSNNHFCWAVGDCPAIIDRLLAVIKVYNKNALNLGTKVSDALASNFEIHSAKYAGINLSSIDRYGSLEFRMHQGTSDITSIIRWINVLGTIKNYAMLPNLSPTNILETKESQGIGSIFKHVLGRYQGLLNYPNVEDDILYGARLAQDFVVAIDPTRSINYNTEIPTRDPFRLETYLKESVGLSNLNTAGRTRLNATM